MRFILLFILLCTYCFPVSAHQDIVHRHYSKQDGLLTNEFYDVTEDQDGFIWLGSELGVFRFDGQAYKKYQHPEQKGVSIFGLKKDAENRIWYTNTHSQLFYIQNNEVFLFVDLVEEMGAKPELYDFLVEDNQVFIYNKTTFLKINISDKRIVKLSTSVLQQPPFSYRGAQYVNDTLFISKLLKNRVEIYSYSNGESFPKLYASYNFKHNIEKALPSFFQFQKQLYLLDTNLESPILYTVQKNEIKPIQHLDFLKGKRIIRSKEVFSKLCIFTYSGVFTICRNSPFTSKLSLNKAYFPYEAVTDVLHDQNANFWFSTLYNGLFVIPNLNVHKKDIDRKKGSITAIETIDDYLLAFGTNLGYIGTYNLTTGNIDYYSLPKRSGVFNLLYLKENNQLLISTTEASSSFLFDLENKTVQTVSTKYAFQTAKNLQLITKDSIFYSTAYTDYILELKDKKVVSRSVTETNDIRRGVVFYDQKRNIVYKTFSDRLIAAKKGGKEQEIHFSNLPIRIRSITQTENGVVWVLTFDNKIHGIDGYKVIKTYSIDKGFDLFQSNNICAYKNNLWLSSNHGLQLIETKSNTLYTFSDKKGLEAPNINEIKINEHCIWIQSNYSVYGIYKRGFTKKEKNYKEAPYFSKIMINHQEQPIQDYYQLTTEDKDIDIHFNTNGYRSSDLVNYRYKLNSRDSNWQYLPKGLRSVKLNNLPNGKHTFLLQTLGNKAQTKRIELHVQSKWYKQAWLLSTFAILAILAILGLFSYLLQVSIKKKKARLKQEQLDLQKTMHAQKKRSAASNSEFITKTLKDIQRYILNSSRNDSELILEDYNNLIVQYLKQSSKEEISLEEEIDTIKRYLDLEKIRQENNLFYTIQIAQNILPEETLIPSQIVLHQIEKAIQANYGSRSNENLIIVEFKKDDDNQFVLCEIQDNGNGRLKKEKQGYKDPLTITQHHETIEAFIQGEKRTISIQIEDLYAGIIINGTRVTIKMPIHINKL